MLGHLSHGSLAPLSAPTGLAGTPWDVSYRVVKCRLSSSGGCSSRPAPGPAPHMVLWLIRGRKGGARFHLLLSPPCPPEPAPGHRRVGRELQTTPFPLGPCWQPPIPDIQGWSGAGVHPRGTGVSMGLTPGGQFG